ncbi:aldehyde dehydrogenase family protein [Pseudonocardia sp.]|jgi:betaine-aldehyde dehydrogenase|uniref:aldehyde dehydrogenase family protein n=1 Tax=Pseudonocardia sp. TaxID=60912 RepID=UPI00261B2453|nr:aldehyde dehydrogenase family protein [Pseudonocardia sp.]MCW2722516.1 aldehyde dehydrogenase [Pseudonocardia sp.]
MQPTSAELRTELQVLLKRDWRMLIGGELVPAGSGETMTTSSPSDGSVLGTVPLAGPSDVERAVRAAQGAFPAWRDTPLTERVALLRRFAGVLQEHARELGLLDAADCGNPVTAMIGDVAMATRWMEYQTGVAFEVKGSTLPSLSRSWLLTRREPYGVVGRIIPYNHPILFAAGKIGAPVVMGNTLVLKLPDQAPLSGLLLAELAAEVFPPGVLNVITGTGAVTGDALVRHPEVKRIALIGSVPTGQRVQAAAAEVAVKHVSLELGGKNAMIVCPDADLDAVVEGAAFGMNCHWCQGQSCGSTTRLFLHDDIHDEVLERLLERLRTIRIGDPLDPATEMGCLVSEAQFDKVTSYIAAGHEDGARLVTGGGRPEGAEFADGFFVAPTVFADVDMGMRIAKEEIFGPVLSVLRWNDLDDVVAQANSLPYGLTGAVWTRDIQTGLSVADRLDTGYVWINGSGSHFLGAPFSGHKDSGTDSEEGIEELISYTQTKTVNITVR